MRRSIPVTLAVALSLITGLFAIGPNASGEPRTRPVTVKEYLLSRPTPKMDQHLEDELASADPDEMLPVLVGFQGPQLTDANVALLQDLGFPTVMRFRILPVAAAAGTPDMIRALADESSVRRIELNRDLEYHLNRSTKTIKADGGVWDRYLKEGNRIRMPIDGRGVTIAVIDTGVDATHPDLPLGSKVVVNKKFLGQSVATFLTHEENHGEVFESIGLWLDLQDTDNTSVHGTHVSGIAAGSGVASDNSAGLGYAGAEATNRRGTAPGARIYGLGSGEGLTIINALAAFDQIYHELKDRGNPFNLRVINNSWGGPGEFNPDAFVTQAVMVLSYDMDQYAPAGKRFNQHVVFSAGNDGGDGFDTTNLWGRIPVAMSVANVSKNGFPPNNVADPSTAVSSSSSLGVPNRPETFPDLAAPGTGIISALPHAHWGTPYVPLSGTSMAAPHVSGTIALMLEAYPGLGLAGVSEDHAATAPAQYQDPFLNEISEAEWILQATAEHVIGSTGQVTGASYMGGDTTGINDGYGLIDAEAAVATALALKQLRETDPSATVADALAAAPALIENVTETHNEVDTLSTAFWGRAFTWGTDAVWIQQGYSFTVPETFEELKMTLRWAQTADMDLRLEVPMPDGSLEAATLTTAQTPDNNGTKFVRVLPGTQSPDLANAVKGDPERPWTLYVLTRRGVLAGVDWQVTLEVKHSGIWDVGRDTVTGQPNGPDTVLKWGDWHDADNGAGQHHFEVDEGDGHNIDMRYYNLDGSTVKWHTPGDAPGGSSKFDAKASFQPNTLPTKTIRLSREAWRAWHQAEEDFVPPPPDPTDLQVFSPGFGQYTDTVVLKAWLQQTGAGVGGQTITFDLGAQQVTAVTGPGGVAETTMQLLQPPGGYTLTASFDGAEELPPSSTSTPFEITKEDSALGLDLADVAGDLEASATLVDADTPSTGVSGRSIEFSQDGASIGTALTDPSGVATLVVPGAPEADYAASFAGDPFFLPSEADAPFDLSTFVTITDAPDPIEDVHVDHVVVEGLTEIGNTVSITITDGTRLATGPATVDAAGGFVSAGIDVTGLANGTLTIAATGEDEAGNVAVDLLEVIKDTSGQPPLVKIVDDDANHIVDDTAVPIEVTYQGPLATADATVTVTDSLGTTVALPDPIEDMALGETETVVMDISTLADGVVTANADFGDTVGEDDAILDRVGPTVTLDDTDLLYLSVPFVFSNVAFSGTATDATAGIHYVEVRVKGADGGIDEMQTFRADGANSFDWSASWTGKGFIPGQYVVEVTAYDEVGIASDTVKQGFLVV